jgi:hypothetical protein
MAIRPNTNNAQQAMRRNGPSETTSAVTHGDLPVSRHYQAAPCLNGQRTALTKPINNIMALSGDDTGLLFHLIMPAACLIGHYQPCLVQTGKEALHSCGVFVGAVVPKPLLKRGWLRAKKRSTGTGAVLRKNHCYGGGTP